MLEELEFKGDWKLPDDKEWTKGTLTFSPTDGAKLEIHGTFNKSILDKTGPDIILGKTTEGLVTLVDCFYRTTKASYDTNITIGQYLPRYILQGKHFENKAAIEFSKVTLTLFNFFEWLDTTGRDSKLQKFDASVSYQRPERLGPFRIDDALSIDVDFTYHVETGPENRKFNFLEDAKVGFTYANTASFGTIMQDINIFENFVTMAVFEQSYPTSLQFKFEGAIVYCYYRGKYNSSYAFRHNSSHILQYKTIKEIFPNVLTGWFQQHKAIEPVFNLLLYSFRDKRKIGEDKFMDLCRALEIFHRSVINSTPYSEDKFDHMYKRIVFNVFECDQQWLEGKLQHANEHNLEARIHNLYKRFATTYNKDRIDDKQEFIKTVVATRNYYTHYNPKYKETAMRHEELYHATKMLIGLLIASIYQHLGIPKELFEVNMNDATI